eukprot:6412776-Amphidinium_carterae.1
MANTHLGRVSTAARQTVTITASVQETEVERYQLVALRLGRGPAAGTTVPPRLNASSAPGAVQLPYTTCPAHSCSSTSWADGV